MSLSQSHIVLTRLSDQDDGVIETIDIDMPPVIEAIKTDETVVQGLPERTIDDLKQSVGSDWEVEDCFQPVDAPSEHLELGASNPSPLTPFSISSDRLPPPETHLPDSSQGRDQTVIQYKDAAIYQPADQTVVQGLIRPVDAPKDETVCQQSLAPVPWHSSETSSVAIVPQSKRFRSINLLALWQWRRRSPVHAISSAAKNLLHSLHRLKLPKLRQVSSYIPTRLKSKQAIAPQSQPLIGSQSSRDSDRDDPSQSYLYQKTLQELDHCRLSFARELARNGKFREAIAVASQISETSRFFTDSQTLVQSWGKR